MSIKDNVIKYRRAKGMSQSDLARAINVAQNTIATVESGKTRKTKYLPEIAKALGVSLTDLDPTQGYVTAQVVPGTVFGSKDLPIYGMVEAGAGAIVMSSEPVDRIARPEELLSVKDAYGLIVAGHSMVPVLRPGITIWVNPHIYPRVDDICVFISEDSGQALATIKEYRGQTEEVWRVRRYGPKEHDFTLAKKEWQKCHVVVGDRRR